MGKNGNPTPPSLLRKLKAVGAEERFKSVNSGCLDTPRFNEIVLWLEEEKIRFRPIDDRKPLRDWTDGKAWWDAVMTYGKDLGVHVAPLREDSERNRLFLLDALAALAVQDIYMDLQEEKKITMLKEKTAKGSKAATSRRGSGASKRNNDDDQQDEGNDDKTRGVAADGADEGSGGADDDVQKDDGGNENEGSGSSSSVNNNNSNDYEDRMFEEAVNATNDLLAAFRLPVLPLNNKATNAELLGALRAIQTRVRPPSSETMENLPHEALKMDLRALSGAARKRSQDEYNDTIVAFRLIHAKQLRHLQDEINDVITELQQFTSEPKTNARLGKVGH